jgi:threonine dehydratase
VCSAALLAGKIRPAGPTAVVISGRNADMGQFLKVANGESITLGEAVVKG